jgi:hypothetical protein
MTMATKTIPEYLEDERRNSVDTQLRAEEEAAHIRSLHHGHHRTQKPPKLELPAPVEAVAKVTKPAAAKTGKPTIAKTRKPVAEARRTSRAPRKTGTKARRTA